MRRMPASLALGLASQHQATARDCDADTQAYDENRPQPSAKRLLLRICFDLSALANLWGMTLTSSAAIQQSKSACCRGPGGPRIHLKGPYHDRCPILHVLRQHDIDPITQLYISVSQSPLFNPDASSPLSSCWNARRTSQPWAIFQWIRRASMDHGRV
ncbi:hypothetical protein J3E74DRAFT_407523 [Bipolaris maydis]|nr:hypothetical protein J3E74DRAFT_412321 [Bipolaris maydis]KAJ5059774.1 hypothetical protein J3E74DRAFT_407523 [Bipolaris maydis]